LLLLVVIATIIHRRQERRGAEGSWWSSPRRRAEVGEAHPYLGSFLIMAVLSAPFGFASVAINGKIVSAIVLWAGSTALGTLTVWILVWRQRRNRRRR
jgi:hypothetical protein